MIYIIFLIKIDKYKIQQFIQLFIMSKFSQNLIQSQLQLIIRDCNRLHILNVHQSLLILSKYNVKVTPLTDKFNSNSLLKLFRSSSLQFYEQDEVATISKTYDRFPYFIVIRGNVDIFYKNIDNKLEFLENIGMNEFYSLDKEKLIKLHNENELSFLKNFQIQAREHTLILSFPMDVVEEIEREKSEIIIRLIIREKQILKYYGLEVNQFKLQTINQSLQFQYENVKFLLLRGLMCICKDNLLLAAYKEGMYDTNINFKFLTKFLIFEGSEIIFVDDKESVTKISEKHAVQRREEHISKLLSIYQNLSQNQQRKMQSLFIQKNQINESELSKFMTIKNSRNSRSKLNIGNIYRSVSTLENINKKPNLQNQKILRPLTKLGSIKKLQIPQSPIKLPKVSDKEERSTKQQFRLRKIQKNQY